MTIAESPVAVATRLYIDGEEVDGGDGVLTVVDPARGGTIGTAAAATREQALDAVRAANAAFPAWAALSPQERAAQIDAAVAAIGEHFEEHADILSRENGKVLDEARGDVFVFGFRCGLATGLADQVLETTTLPGPPNETIISYVPRGVVTIIVPFNWPLAILGASLPYALVAGNTVILKPPPSAPLATSLLIRRMAEHLPPGVLNVVTGKDAEIGEALVSNTDVSMVHFTGSVRGGNKMMEMASKSLTKVALELGGNDAAVVLKDADLGEEGIDALYHGIFDTTGQICMAAKRVYVDRSRYQEVVDGLSRKLEQTVLGDGRDPNTTMGPLHAPSQKKFVEDLLNEAREAGAEIREFGELPGGEFAEGNFLRPSLVLDPDPKLRVVTEEQFGPTIPIIPFDDEDQAIAAANDTWAGLCASVWTADRAKAAEVGARLQAGYVFVNAHSAAVLDQRAPFGGVKRSGLGREMGIEGLREFMDTHSVALPA
ncbi:aldehyde dehydrogenase family protein [Naasia aerilata]|uniref:aldehyde dehydrogenase (NAD(+)) n=1 Tax=Naasia aerilata TaxID=1162966 RepID=A0ABN6XMR3_9MICO|nr:aldehyde dehydrogenase family protein [Naasia aerilata]BDZ46194.1 aldehyde dehydrogenase [Naasia aerilata]